MSDNNTFDIKLEYNIEFQEKIISSILTDDSYAKKIIPIIKSKYFDGDSLQWILNNINYYYNKYKTIPNMSFFKNELLKEENDLLIKQIKTTLSNVKKWFPSIDLQYVKDDSLTFCTNASMTEAIWKATDLLAERKFDSIPAIIKQALDASNINDDDVNYKEDIYNRYKEDKLSYIPTRWDIVNRNMKGGLPAGSLTMFVGASGRGKSWLLCDIGQYASMQGYRVAHYTLELSSDYVGRRYDTITTTMSDDDITEIMKQDDDSEQKKNFINTIQSIKGNIDITYYSPNYGTISMIRSNIETKIQKNEKPNIIIIDYPDLLGSNNGDASNLDIIYKGCKAIAMDYNVPVVIVTQSNRDGMKSDVIKEHHIAEHIGKLNICDIVFSWNRNDEEEDSGRLWWIKNRYGRDKIQIEFDFILQHGMINAIGESKLATDTEKINKLKKNAKELANKNGTFNNKFKNAVNY